MNKKTEVKCSGMMLTAGFHAANPPLIWRFDLERNHSFTLALQGEEGDWELGVTSPKGEFYPVVHFLAREDAEEAFIKIEKVLSRKRGPMSYIIKALLAVAALACLVVLGMSLFVYYVANKSLLPMMPRLTSAHPPLMQLQPPQDGVPQSADDILQAPH
ncbi:MAG: hypothetical protein WCD70_03050 [Alphaproteobacteria bacterium]